MADVSSFRRHIKMSPLLPSKKKQSEFHDQCNNLILLAKGTLLTDTLDTSPFHALSKFCACNHFDLRERMSDALNNVREGWEQGTGPALELPHMVIEVVHLARDRLMEDFGLEDGEGEQDSDKERDTIEHLGRGKPVSVANRPLILVIEAVAHPSLRAICAKARSLIDDEAEEDDGESEDEVEGEDEMEEEEDCEEEDQIVEGQEGSEDGLLYAEDFKFDPSLQSPSTPQGWFPWQDKRNMVHFDWTSTNVAPHSLVEGMYDLCKVLLKQNVQDSWEQVDIDHYFKGHMSQSRLWCQKSSKTCTSLKGSDGIITCGACKSSSQGCSHNLMIPIMAVMKKFRDRLSMSQVIRILHGMGWASFQGVKITNAFFKSVLAFPKLPIRLGHPSFVSVPPPSLSHSQLGIVPNPLSGPSPGDAVRAKKRKAHELQPSTSRTVITRSEPPVVSKEVRVSKKSLGKHRAVEPEVMKHPSKKLKVIPLVKGRDEDLGRREDESEVASCLLALKVVGNDPQDLRSMVPREVMRPRPQRIVAVSSPHEDIPTVTVPTPGSLQGIVQAVPEPPQLLPSNSVPVTPQEDPVANVQATLQSASRPVASNMLLVLSDPPNPFSEPSIKPLEKLIPRNFYDEATTEVNLLRIQLAEEIRKRQEAEKKVLASRADFLFMSQASRMAVNASDIMVEIATKSKQVDTMVHQVVEDIKKREWQDEEPLEGMMPVFLEVKELCRELAVIKEELAETKTQLDAVKTAGISEAESSVKRLESELDRLKNRDELNNHQLQNALAGGAKLALTSMHDVLPLLSDTTNDLTSSFNTLSEAVNGLPSEGRNAILGRLRPFKDSAQRVHRLIQSLHNVFRSESMGPREMSKMPVDMEARMLFKSVKN
ncbi:hypothetical protein V5O48_016021 [Marasmius crinis-equi]|uniref:Uncharacterized protein n=1 Tax=Marasmius crinis-equi TaxID=585013 RepID=A0ABR3ESZ1_9AGAR